MPSATSSKRKRVSKTNAVAISVPVHRRLAKFAKANGLKVQWFADRAITIALDKEGAK